MTLVDRKILKTPQTLAEVEAETGRPAVLLLTPDDFVLEHSILRWRSRRPQRVLAALRTLLRAERFEKGAVCVVGHSVGQRRPYPEDLGRRRAEAVKAAICGDAQRALDIMQRLYKVETVDRHRPRWLRAEAEHLLELVLPDEAIDDNARIRRFQEDCGILADGVTNRETWDAILEAYANEVSLAPWIAPNKVYTAIGVPSFDPGQVEIWVWPMWPPPAGSMASWRARNPIVLPPAEGDDTPPAASTAVEGATNESAAGAAAGSDAGPDDFGLETA